MLMNWFRFIQSTANNRRKQHFFFLLHFILHIFFCGLMKSESFSISENVEATDTDTLTMAETFSMAE